MKTKLDLSTCKPTNNLWSDFVKTFGIEKAHQAVREAINLQRMQGDLYSLPIFFISTGGIALISFETLKKQTGLNLETSNKILLYCHKRKSYQVIHELKSLNRTI